MLKNALKHFKLITKHKWLVFKLCTKIGMPIRGLRHDLSKYSPTEFIESAKNYKGNMSAITAARIKNGYSKAWLHHKAKNKHHMEYWMDLESPEKYILIPYKYMAEMVCDQISAGMVYKGKEWTKEHQLQYWNRVKEKSPLNDKLKNFLTDVYTQLAEEGIKKTITKDNLKTKYYNHI